MLGLSYAASPALASISSAPANASPKTALGMEAARGELAGNSLTTFVAAASMTDFFSLSPTLQLRQRAFA